VLLVDTVGELMKFYAVSDVVFIGGSLVPTGGHNILEPASLRVPVLFGPNMTNFREAAENLLACGGGVQVDDVDGLAGILEELLADGERRHDMGERGARLLEENSGATRRHVQAVERLQKGS
jgi:3-deoxy-D-manno-octulosonic-acid transferase